MDIAIHENTFTENNSLTAYCFLSALTENQHDLYQHVYLPICKRALSKFSTLGSTGGRASEIKELINAEYGIDVPEIIVQKLIKAVEDQLSRKEKINFNFKTFENGKSFQISKYVFADVEDKFVKGARDANQIQSAFDEFIKAEEPVIEIIPSFTEFLNKNKNTLSNYFRGVPEPSDVKVDITYLPHVRFLEKISKANHDLYKIAESLYLGTIVASFLESGIDLGIKFSEGEVYYVDTPLLLSALDLNKEADTQPAKELFKLITSTGGKLKILSITVEESQAIINRAYQSYNNKVPTSDVNEACLRTGKKRTDLALISQKLIELIEKEFEIVYEHFPEKLVEKYKKLGDIDSLKEQRLNKGSAVHDVLAYQYVRNQRSGNISSHQKAKVWFLTSNKQLYNFVSSLNDHHIISEIALPDALTSLLWLKNPDKNVSKIKSIGLSELMASTMSEEIAGADLINEFAEQIKSIDCFSQEDYKILLESVAHESARNIERILSLKIKDPDKQKIEAQRLVEKERARRKVDFEGLKSAQKTIYDYSLLSTEFANKETEYQKTLKENQEKLVKFQNLIDMQKVNEEIRDWQRPGYYAIGLGLVLVVYFLLHFYCLDSEYNFVHRLITYTDNLESDTVKNTLRTLLYAPILAFVPLTVIFCKRFGIGYSDLEERRKQAFQDISK